MQKFHKNVKLPHRKSRKRPLSKDKKTENKELSSQRVIVENVIGLLKRFKIIADRYRNRRRRFGLRFNIVDFLGYARSLLCHDAENYGQVQVIVEDKETREKLQEEGGEIMENCLLEPVHNLFRSKAVKASDHL